MEKELVQKLVHDGKFKTFYTLVTLLKAHGYEAYIPFDTAWLLYKTGVELVEGKESLS